MVKNSGYYTFISKWGMTARTFTKKFLRSGESFNGPLSEPVLSFSVSIKNGFKRLQGLLHTDRR
jgi:hypothetical protein